MTKNQILDIHAHTLRANFHQTAAALSYIDPKTEAFDYICNAEIAAFERLAKFYDEHFELFNEEEAIHLTKAIVIWSNAGEKLTDEEADALTEAECSLYDYYNENIDEDGYFDE